MFDAVEDSIPVRPIQIRLAVVLVSVVVLTVAFGVGLYWVVPAVWALFSIGTLVIIAGPTVGVAWDRAGQNHFDTAVANAQAELGEAWTGLYGLFTVPTDLPSPAFVVGVSGFLLVAQFAYTQRALDIEPSPYSDETERHVEPIVQRLCKQASTPVPDVIALDEDVPRSFAVGQLRSGAIVVTTGLVDQLDDEELEAVLAHEVAHFVNGDVSYMTFLALLPLLEDDSVPIFGRLVVTTVHLVEYVWSRVVAAVPRPVRIPLLEIRRGIGRGYRFLREIATKIGAFLLALLLVDVVYLDFAIIGLCYHIYAATGLSPVWAGIVVLAGLSVFLVSEGYPLFFLAPAWLFARLVAVVFSRTTGPLVAQFARDRELAADRAAGLLTGNPAALASALSKLDPDDVVQSTDLREHAGLVSLSVFPYVLESDESAWSRITDHPPTDERIDRLQDLQAELQ